MLIFKTFGLQIRKDRVNKEIYRVFFLSKINVKYYK